MLHRLERNGLVAARWGTSEAGRRRKYYRLTNLGAEELDRQQRQWQLVDATLRGVWRTRVEPGFEAA